MNRSSREAEVLSRVLDTDPVAWIERNFYIEDPRDPITGEQFKPGPIILTEFQKKILRYALTKVNGLFPYTTILYSTIKKSGKTRIAAAVAAWYAATQGKYNEVYCLANDGKQSSDRILSAVRKAVELNPKLDWNITQTKITLPNGTFIEAIPCDAAGQAGSNPGLTVWSEMWGYKHEHKERLWCYDDKTKILTKRGWIYGKDLLEGDVVATVTPHTHIFQWEKVDYIFKKHYTGKMHLYESSTFSECVTPEHRLYGVFSKNWKHSPDRYEGIVRSSELREFGGFNVYYPLTNVYDYESTEAPKRISFRETYNNEAFSISWSDWCEYAGWYLSEGHVIHNTYKDNTYPVSVKISQDREAHPFEWDKIKQYHEKVFPDKWRLVDNDTSFTVHSIPFAKKVKEVFGNGTRNKRVPENIKNTNRENLQRFFDAFVFGDGFVQENGSIQISIGNKGLAEDLWEIGFKLGYTVSIKKVYPKNKDWYPYWRLYLSPQKDGYSRELSKYKGHWKEIDYDGVVWCPKTENGLVVVSRKGKTYVSGNTEMTIPPTRYGKAIRWVESYAGYTGESHTLENLYAVGVNEGVRHPAFDVVPVYVNPRAKMFAYWDSGDQARRMPWQNAEYYMQEKEHLTEQEFNRIHRNLWANPVDKAIEIEWWDNCEDIKRDGKRLPPLDDRTPVVLGVDAAVSGDSTGMVLVSRHPDNKKETAVRFCKSWKPPIGGKLDLERTVGHEIERLCEKYNVIEVAYDEYQLHHLMTEKKKLGLTRIRDFSQASLRYVADKTLRDMIIHKQIVHSGQEDLREHIDNAAIHQVSESKMRFIKLDESKKYNRTARPIDLIVALSMANYRLHRLIL